MATLAVPSHVPSPSEDAEELRKAFAGWGTNEGLIISILAHRNAAQRKQIRQAYSDVFGEDLLKVLDKELTRDFERVVLLWTLDPSERDALLAFESAKKWHAADRTFIEIACTRSSDELLLVRKAYHARYKKSLEEDVAAHTKDAFRKLLVPLVSSLRYDGPEVNVSLAKSEAKLLHSKISDKAYTDDELVRIITTRSKAQLFATFNEYNNDIGHPINKDLKEDPKDEYLTALRAIIKTITNPEKYFEKTLRLAINKTGTDEGALTRVITTRAEVDLKLIKDAFKKRNTVPLDKAIPSNPLSPRQTQYDSVKRSRAPSHTRTSASQYSKVPSYTRTSASQYSSNDLAPHAGLLPPASLARNHHAYDGSASQARNHHAYDERRGGTYRLQPASSSGAYYLQPASSYGAPHLQPTSGYGAPHLQPSGSSVHLQAPASAYAGAAPPVVRSSYPGYSSYPPGSYQVYPSSGTHNYPRSYY